ncbi:MAG: hypothetical protein M3094_11555, partial [Actinomycetia bacterium]|nr:hypothetical protein [Actinomycetes bacterium]
LGQGVARISNPPGTSQPIGIEETIKRINVSHRHMAHGVYSDTENSIRWYVPLDNDITCRHAIVYDLQRGRWSLHTASNVVTAEVVVGQDGGRSVLAGDSEGNVFELDVSNTDGAFGFEPKTTVATGATTRVISLNGTPSLPTTGDGLSGIPVLWISAAGVFEISTIASNTSSQVTLVTGLSSAPSENDVILIGAIHARLRSGRFNLGLTNEDKSITDFDLTYAPGDDGRAFLSFAGNQAELKIPTIGEVYAEMTDADGHTPFRENTKARQHEFQVDVFEPGTDVSLLAVEMTIEARRRDRRGV